MATTLREQLIAKLDELNEEQIRNTLLHVEALIRESDELPEDYDPDNDPTVGFISGPTDLSSRAKEILREEITPLSGWTQKNDTP
jgi:hypothetical protein